MHGTYPVKINMGYEASLRANLQSTLVAVAKGRGVERVIFSVKDGVVTIHDIDNYHK